LLESHNLLASLASATEIRGLLTSADPKLSNFHRIMARQGSSLTRLVGDLLDAAQVSIGRFGLKTHTLLLADITIGAVETSQPALATRNKNLSINLPLEPIMLDGDLVRF
jgi:K+-sensing histidine kinase KdpD